MMRTQLIKFAMRCLSYEMDAKEKADIRRDNRAENGGKAVKYHNGVPEPLWGKLRTEERRKALLKHAGKLDALDLKMRAEDIYTYQMPDGSPGFVVSPAAQKLSRKQHNAYNEDYWRVLGEIDAGKIRSDADLQKRMRSFMDAAKGPAPVTTKLAAHSLAKCMKCAQPPTHECKWAEGMGRAWFCDKHWKEFEHQHRAKDGFKSDINVHRAVKGGRVGKKYGEEQ